MFEKKWANYLMAVIGLAAIRGVLKLFGERINSTLPVGDEEETAVEGNQRARISEDEREAAHTYR